MYSHYKPEHKPENNWKLTNFGWRKKTAREMIDEGKIRKMVKDAEINKILARPRK